MAWHKMTLELDIVEKSSEVAATVTSILAADASVQDVRVLDCEPMTPDEE